MYRALYAHNSKLPKYLSFEAGDKFTLIDTSKSDQWFLAQNGLGEIGFVPFNYIKKIEATTDEIVRFIDGAMEAIHLQATNAGGQYTHEQRLIMKKLVKHRSDVIKNATAGESKSAHRRRPAPAPPVDRSLSVDSSGAALKAVSLAVIGRRATVTSDSTTSESKRKSDVSKERGKNKKESSPRHDRVSSRESKNTHSADPRRTSALSETARKEVTYEENVRKSKSVTSSIGQAPSLASSFSSNTSDLTNADFLADSSKCSDEGHSGEENLSTDGFEVNQSTAVNDDSKFETCSDDSDHKIKSSWETQDGMQKNEQGQECCVNAHESRIQNSLSKKAAVDDNDQGGVPPPPLEYCNNDDDEVHVSTASSASGVNDHDLSSEDLPPPPPEVYADIDDDHFEVDDTLPPAPPDFTSQDDLKADEFYMNLNADILEICGKKPMEECHCEDFQPKFDLTGTFFAQNSLILPPPHNVKVSKKERYEPKQVSNVYDSLLKSQADSEDLSRHHNLLELAQAYCVQITHADCEEMIGEFRKVTNLSHEESHWAILTVMNLLAAKVPHIKPSLEVVGMRLNMAHECRSTGRDYECEDMLTLDRLISELAAVTGDSQQRGHYLRDDLDSIIDIITGLTDTLNNAKLCVSMAAIEKDNFNMVEIIAKYYQMETRWVIRSCLLHLIDLICRLNPLAVQEFLYTELPQEMVAEMQQHHNDDARFLQVAKTLGVVFMKGLPSPHKLSLTMDIPFFIWLLGMIENMAELNRLNDVDLLLALVCAYHLQHEDNSQNPVTEALKMAHGHALLESALIFLSKHDDPTKLLGSNIEPKLNSVILLLSHLFDNPDTSDLLYTNDVEALIGIFEEFLRDLTRDDPLRKQIMQLLENFMRNYPDTVSMRGPLCKRLGPLLLNIREEKNKCGEMAAQILDDNSIIFDDI